MIFLILGRRSLQPVLFVPRCSAAEAEEWAGGLFNEPHGVWSVVPGIITTVATVHLPGKLQTSSTP